MSTLPAGAVGEWHYPNGDRVPRANNVNSIVDFARLGFTQQVRLAREVFYSIPPLGLYTCVVPCLSTGVLYYASINITNGKKSRRGGGRS